MCAHLSAIVEYMLSRPDEFAPFLDDDEDEDLNTYLRRMSKDAEWGGNLELAAGEISRGAQ